VAGCVCVVAASGENQEEYRRRHEGGGGEGGVGGVAKQVQQVSVASPGSLMPMREGLLDKSELSPGCSSPRPIGACKQKPPSTRRNRRRLRNCGW